MITEAVSATRTAALIVLFERASSPCFCRFWHFTGTKNEWLERCAFRPEDNANELAIAIAAGDETGVIAIDGDDVIGWMKVARRRRLPKLRRLPVYKSLDLGDEDTTFAIGCLLVDPAWRKKGVARAMLSAAPDLARSLGGRALEAYPRRASHPLYDEEAFLGPEALYVDLGWKAVHDVAPYPVYRTVLAT